MLITFDLKVYFYILLHKVSLSCQIVMDVTRHFATQRLCSCKLSASLRDREQASTAATTQGCKSFVALKQGKKKKISNDVTGRINTNATLHFTNR